MNVKTTILSLLAVVMGLMACSRDEMMNEKAQNEQSTGLVKKITATAQPIVFEGENETRTTYNRFKVQWSDNDVLGVLPIDGQQLRFPISEGMGGTTAQFDGGKWALRSNVKYVAYYPFSSDYYGPHGYPEQLYVNYKGQVQKGDYNQDHLSKFDYMVASAQEADKNGNVNFEFNHLGAMVHFKILIDAQVDLIRMVINNSNPIIYSYYYKLASENVSTYTAAQSYGFAVDLREITTDPNYDTNIFAMLPPCQLNGRLGVVDTNGNYYEGALETVDIQAGKGYVVTVRVNATSASSAPDAVMISGEDFNSAVKSMANMVDVSKIAYQFEDYTINKILFATGKRYFQMPTPGYHVVDVSDISSPYPVYAERSNTNSGSVLFIYTLAQKVNIGYGGSMFNNFRNLKDIDFSNVVARDLTSMYGMFKNCVCLEMLDLSAFDTSKVTYMGDLFYNCESLVKLQFTPDFSKVKESGWKDMFWNMGNKASSCKFYTSSDVYQILNEHPETKLDLTKVEMYAE